MVPPISQDIAFNKGVDYFTELVFFYGVMFGIAVYELDRTQRSSKKQADAIWKVDAESNSLKTKLDVQNTEVRKIKTLQTNNRRNIEDLEAKVGSLEKILEQKLQQLEKKLAMEAAAAPSAASDVQLGASEAEQKPT